MARTIEITPEMKRQFSAEVAEHLNTFEQMLLALERQPNDPEAIRVAFRAVHSVKGSSDYVGIRDINALSHELEDLMDQARSGRLAIAEEALSVLFEGLDRLRDMNRRIAEGGTEESDISALLDRLEKLKSAAGEEDAPVSRPREEMDVEAVFAATSAQHCEYLRRVAEGILAGESGRGARQKVLRILKTFRTSAGYVEAADIAALLEEMERQVEAVQSLRRKRAGFLLEKLDEVEGLVSRLRKPEAAAGTTADFSVELLEEEIRVSPEKIDGFMNQVAELAIAKNALNYLAEKATSGSGAPEAAPELRRAAARIDRIAGRLQDSAMDLRLVRINALFARLPRLVRELARQRQKRIELSLSGGEIEIDRKVIELLVDPLIHLIRNAADHGIESPAERAKKGKSEVGQIAVKARQEGNHAIIEVIDDGRGLRAEAIGKTALEKGLVTREALVAMADEEIIHLVFAPGFTTVPQATSVSGRGVGLDVVQNNMKRLGGNATLRSEADQATRVRLQVPISMAVMDALLTEVAGELYAFPFSAILETLVARAGQIQVLNGRETIPYRGTVLALEHLGAILGMREGEQLRVRDADEELPIVALRFGGQIRGIAVDRIGRREGILARPLEAHLAGIREFSGAALRGDGRIVLVLNPAGLFRGSPQQHGGLCRSIHTT